MDGRLFRRAGAVALGCVLVQLGVAGGAHASNSATEQYSGTLHVLAAMYPSGAQVSYVLSDARGHTLRLHPRASLRARLERLAEHRVRVQGARRGNDVTVTDAASIQAIAAAAPKQIKLAVLMVNFTTDTSTPYSAIQLKSNIFTNAVSTANYWRESTGGQVQITGDIFGWYTIPFGTDGCNNIMNWMTQAEAKATAAGVNLDNYTNYELWFPWTDACGGWAGIGTVGGNLTWIENPPYYTDKYWAWPAHELGHNLTLLHSRSLACGSVPLQADLSQCSSDEYGDPFDVMGQGWADPGDATGLHKAALGVVKPVVASAPGNYTLVPDEQPNAAQTQVLEVPRGDGSFFVLDYRQPSGTFDDFAASAPIVNGVTVHLLHYDAGGLWQSDLLDMTPDGVFTDSSLRAGRSFTDPLSGMTIAVNSLTSANANVTVNGLAPPQTRAVVNAGKLVVVATSSSDAISVTRNASGVITVSDTAHQVAAGLGCNSVSMHAATCAGATSVLVRARGGDDHITVNVAPLHAKIKCGDGTDTVAADAGDTLKDCEHVTLK